MQTCVKAFHDPTSYCRDGKQCLPAPILIKHFNRQCSRINEFKHLFMFHNTSTSTEGKIKLSNNPYILLRIDRD